MMFSITHHFRGASRFLWLVLVLSQANAQSPTQAQTCQQAQDQIRYYFMEYQPDVYLNLKYLEDMYYLCESPNLQTSISYYYLKSISLLNVSNGYVAAPSDLFRYFFKQYQHHSSFVDNLAWQDPEFVARFRQRDETLRGALAMAEKAGNSAILGGNYPPSGNTASERQYGQQNGPNVPADPGRGTQYNELTVPNFPMPIEYHSSDISLPERPFRGAKKLADIDARISGALNSQGYYSKAYFSVPEGFAVVTQLEHIHPDGTPKRTLERWNTSVNHKKTFSLREYFISLVFAKPGYYRTFIFLVTPKNNLSQKRFDADRYNSFAWQQSEGEKLPLQVGTLTYTTNYAINAYVYEFEVPADGGEALLIRSAKQGGKALPAQQHLEYSGLWNVLTK